MREFSSLFLDNQLENPCIVLFQHYLDKPHAHFIDIYHVILLWFHVGSVLLKSSLIITEVAVLQRWLYYRGGCITQVMLNT